jgi:hypothetical protein
MRPAYRGLAYMCSSACRRRLRQPHSAALVRDRAPDRAAEKWCAPSRLIPGTTEFGYEMGTIYGAWPGPVRGREPPRRACGVRRRGRARRLQARARTSSASRSWSRGSAATCARQQFTLTPKVDSAIKQTSGSWSVAGLARSRAVVSTVGGRPAFGGTPSDDSVDAPDPGAARARLQDHALSVRDDGYSGRQRLPIRGPARRVSRPIPGAGASPAIRRRASRLAGRHGAAATQIDAFFGIGDPSVGLSPHGAALRAARRGCGRRRCVPDRLGAARPDARALGERRLSGGDAARRAWPPT